MMNSNVPPLLITSAINVSASQTKIVDQKERIDATLKALNIIIGSKKVKEIVVCDGSDFDLQPFIIKIKNPRLIKIEILSFQNNISMVQKKGKGYGEGEIIMYALKNSLVLRNSLSFFKLTSKLWVDNLDDCYEKIEADMAFNYHGILKPKQIDTRFYYVKKKIYEEQFLLAHKKINDNEGKYMEIVFKDILKNQPLFTYVMSPVARIKGLSGSMGVVYEEKYMKWILKSICAKLIISFGIK